VDPWGGDKVPANMGTIVRPRIVGYERCDYCGVLVWQCRVQRRGIAAVDPRPLRSGVYDVMGDGRLRKGVADGLVARYILHCTVCPVSRRRSEKKALREAVEIEVAEALEEGRKPPEPGQLPLLPGDAPPVPSRWRPGWVDLTDPVMRRQPAARPENGVVVVDLRPRRHPVRPS
jgi:hypothetical protein